MKRKQFIVSAAVLAATLIVAPALSAPAVQRIERGSLVLEGIPQIPETVTERLRQYQNIRSASMQAWLPYNKGILIATRFGDTVQIHQVEKPGGSRAQLTFFDEPVGNATLSPRPDVHGFLFTKDVGGSEYFQLFFFDLETGRARMLSDGQSRNGGPSWAHDGRRYVFYTTRRNGHDWDIHLGDVTSSGDSRALLEQGGTWFPGDWSRDDRMILVRRYVSANESYPYILEVETRKLTQVNPKKEKIAYGQVKWSHDGKGLYFTSDEDSEFQRLQYYDIKSGKITVLSGDIPWNVEGVELSDNGRYLAFTTNEDGIGMLHIKMLPDMMEVRLPGMPAGQIYGMKFSPNSRKLAFVLNTPKTPGDVFSLELFGKDLVRWTKSEVGGLDTDKFIPPELIHYKTFDSVDGNRRTIPAFYYKPAGPGPHPVVIQIHGGPEGQARPFFSATRQYWVKELEIAVLQPNVRGSAGYGKSYLKLDNGFKREDSVKDIGALLDWIGTRSELDPHRVAVFGGSYGGYMALASMVHYNDRLRAGIDVVGISNFVTFLQNTKEYRRDLRRVEYGDERDAEMRSFLERIAPSRNASKITKPMLIAQGFNDPRVPRGESEQMVEEIRRNGGTVWYMLAKDEGHGFRKKKNRDFFQAAASFFLQNYLLAEPVARDD